MNQPRASYVARQRKEAGRPEKDRRPSGGKRSNRPRSGHLLKSWFSNHLDIAVSSLMRLMSIPMQTFMTFLVVAVAICTPMLIYSFAQSVQASVARLDATTDISVYLKEGASVAQVEAARTSLGEFEQIESLAYISAEQGLREFEARTGLEGILNNLGENPIPAVFMVSVRPDLVRETSALSALADELGQIDLVDKVVFDYAWVERLQALINLMNRLVLVLGVLLGSGIVLVLGNTIRLEIENRRDEIVIVKLVGATDAFVRRPLLYAGFWYGFMGALIGWVLANLGVAALDQPLGDLSRLYIANFGLGFLDLGVLLVVLMLGSCLGLAGAWLAVARHLSAVEPR